MSVYTCNNCTDRRCVYVIDEGMPDHETCPMGSDHFSACWQMVDSSFAEAILLGTAEQVRRRSE
jgi:hypothetical protein